MRSLGVMSVEVYLEQGNGENTKRTIELERGKETKIEYGKEALTDGTLGFVLKLLEDGEDAKVNPGDESSSPWDAECSGCQRQITGFRYRCVQCNNYNLCSSCESRGLHGHHDVLRLVSSSRPYPPHFFARIQRLYDRLLSTNGLDMQYNHSRILGDLEPMVGDEGLCRCCNGIQDMSEDAMPEKKGKDELDHDLPSVAEVTKGMLDLTGRVEDNKDSEKDNMETVVKDVIDDELTKILKQTTHHLESLAAITDGDAQDDNKQGETLGDEEEITVNITEQVEMEEDDNGNPDDAVQVVDEKKDNNMDTIQGLQHEIDKLLAPLTSMTDSSRSMSSSRDSLVDDHFRSGPFGTCHRSGRDSTEIVTSAIIESNNNSSGMTMGVKKRALRHSSSEEDSCLDGNSNCRGATPKKVSKKESSNSNNNSMIDFDTITVAEVTEIENVYYKQKKDDKETQDEEECEDEEYEYEYYDDDGEEEEEESKTSNDKDEKNAEDDLKTIYKGETCPKKKEEDKTLLLSPREKWGLKKKSGEGEEDPLSRMEVRRALHRAGLDPSLINRPSVASIKEEKEEEKSSTVSSSEKEYKESWRSRYLEPSSSYGATKSVLLSPKIKEARDQMLNMGFTDDEGWLTQLLTMKKGDIGEVLEVLSPVEATSSPSSLLTGSKSRTTSVPTIASPIAAPSRIYGKNKWSSFS